ncbi:ketopantoate reductase family protein [Terrilactibacillus laevilacticus]|uniref:ketopantoate reductase family protein n=1 Tax=Terrilactibacillus laevilacticus TaxID=1380157 RepID=UPI001146EA9D|nr:ketopantoate reductase family protein [Terrilactibacillus laevilacticus]
MKIAIAGSGAMGLRYGILLQEVGNDVHFLDTWDENLAAIKKNHGVKVWRDGENPRMVKVNVYRPEEFNEKVDLIIVFVKDMHTDEMMNKCQHLIDEDTYVLTNQNGIGSVEVIEKYVNKNRIIAGTAVIATVLNGPGDVDFIGKRGAGSVNLVNVTEKPDSFTYELVEEMKKAQMNPTLKTNYKGTLWTKLFLNAVANTLCTLMNITMGTFAAYSNCKELTERIVYEAYRVAEADGVKLEQTREEIVEHILYVSKYGNPLHYPSMHQDMSTGRPTEVDYINGAIVKTAKKHGLEAPTSALLVDLVHLREEMRESKVLIEVVQKVTK